MPAPGKRPVVKQPEKKPAPVIKERTFLLHWTDKGGLSGTFPMNAASREKAEAFARRLAQHKGWEIKITG